MEEELLTFIQIVEQKSITKAANRLHLSQPAVSMQLKKLEKRYETTLIKRHAKQFLLTITGEMLYKRAKQLAQLHKQLEDEISQFHHHVKGSLVIGSSVTIVEYLLPEMIAKFHKYYPAITLTIIVENTAHILTKMKLMQLDVALVEGQASSSELTVHPFLEDEMVLVGPKKATHADLEDPHGTMWLAREKGSGTREFMEHVITTEGWNSAEQIVANSNETIKRLLIEQLGFTVISRRVVAAEIEQGIISELAFNKQLVRKFLIVKNAQTEENHTAETFIQFLESHIKI